MKTRSIALAYGLVAHGSFLVAVAWMAVFLWSGGSIGQGRLEGDAALLANLALLAQFPLLHSLLLSRPGQRWMARLAPAGLGRSLSTTIFATLASAQLLLLFGLWTPSGVEWWRPEGVTLYAWTAGFGLCWLILGKSMSDAGLGIQMGYLGWTSVWRGERPDYGGLPTSGLFAVCRQPIYLSFALILWTGPVWTPDRLMIALPLTFYCAIGPLLKERRYERLYGDEFAEYRERVPYLLPRRVRVRD
jgi:protein-S-isoprenylcysteine O-methyltransferase Ste14